MKRNLLAAKTNYDALCFRYRMLSQYLWVDVAFMVDKMIPRKDFILTKCPIANSQ